LNVFSEATSRLADENEQLAFFHGHDRNALPLCFGWQDILKPAPRNEKRDGKLALVLRSFPEEVPRPDLGRFSVRYWDELRAQDEATRRVHQCDDVEGAILLGVNGLLIQLERDPRLINLELGRMQHGAASSEA
jgi:hypothetical protein